MTAEALGLLFEADTALSSSLSSSQVVVAWAALDKEHEVVGQVLAALQAQGIRTVSPWLLGRRGPAHKQERLDEAIRAAQLVLLILSPHAPASRDVRTTLHLARLYGRPLAALWITGDQQQACLPPSVPSLLSLIDARRADKETIVQGVLGLVEQTAPAEHAKMEEPPLPAEMSFAEESFQQTYLEVLEWPVEEDTLPVESRPLSMLQRRNRQRFLDKVQTFWITGVLDHSLHGMARIALSLAALPDAVEHPWRLVFAQPDRPPLLLEAGTTMSQVYDGACGELLILGEPGAGKTTLLLELARDLIARARSDETLPAPVVFNLSSWSQKQLPLAEWLVEELHLKYQVPRQLGTAWVQTDSLLPLLDGVDEVAAEHREACIKAINAFRWEHGLLPMVVCSRSNDYFMQPQRIVLHSAVTVQPLTPEQIEAYVEQAGEPLSALRAALHRDALLRELTSTPLILSILTLTYQGVSVEEFLRGGLAPTRQQVFEHYVERMLARRGGKVQYRPKQTIHRLAWLAQQLVQHDQTVFYIERMQPDWLLEDRLRLFYFSAVRLLVGLLVAVFFGVIAWKGFGGVGILLSSPAPKISSLISPQPIITSTVVSLLRGFGMVGGLIGGLIGLLIGGLLSRAKKEIEPPEILTWSWEKIQRNPAGYLIGGFVVGLFVGHLIVGLLNGYLLIGLLIIGLVAWLGDSWSRLEPYYRVTPHRGTWHSVYASLGAGGLAGLFVESFVGYFRSFPWPSLLLWPGLLLMGIILWLIVILISSWSRKMIDDPHRVTPNQGIWQSMRNGVIKGLLVALLITSFVGSLVGLSMSSYSTVEVVVGTQLINGQVADWILGLLFGFLIGFIAGLLAGLLNGGIESIKHFVLRLFLWHTSCISWNYPGFLDYASERILLRKVGGGYIFIHRLLLEYFASLDSVPTLDVARAKKEQESPAS
jgi:hypothetical protein